MDSKEHFEVKSDDNIDNVLENLEAVNGYIRKRKLNVRSQRRAIQIWIDQSSTKNTTQQDRIFIDHFGANVLNEFCLMSEDSKNAKLFEDNINLFFQVFTFIFRNQNLVRHNKAQLFVDLYLKLTKIPSPCKVDYPVGIIDSLINCAYNEPNKILFIHDNAALNYCTYFNVPKVEDQTKFWTFCNHLYSLNYGNRSLMNRNRLQQNINHIMTIFHTKSDEDYLTLLFTFLRMLCRLRLLEEIEFDVNQFYYITVEVILRISIRSHESYPKYYPFLSKIWSGIFNRSFNTFQIDTIDKLIVLGSIFSIGLANTLRKLDVGGKWEMSNNGKQSWYIIYFTLVAFPIIDHTTCPWLRKVFNELHVSLQKYLFKHSIEDLSFECQFTVLQYYIKSIVTLNQEISRRDDDILSTFFESIDKEPLLSNRFLINSLTILFPIMPFRL
ncbi:hypothetical protein RF11_11916 [Thelohanellus kitauei]|uniref:Uncharacterized protein n=1 Tax=Thelohanellus kitauei TaxID=669202 RepID=A0A0C2IZZ0_THEKT|nr:hypothetical protein RF11_11916 [Thelohanellus kitauei]